ncbi:DUF4347 domain-containing protein [Nodosilinea sp. LEGE 07298]|uniref:DUF4347 domain-containing protein n=1 Tax=Nodosilinea sp. LEGE 07298 TaxID=2777970 RepID=UPI00188064A2|nr:DUF4347 domain-containing protein [Nodosilinea sp. LEGE 07298]MBE9111866.1 DUF4347 domain-containing protein [Nodosilinea sp. LEGE 07298]
MLRIAQSVVFIDANVSDVQHLVDGVLPGVAVQVLVPDTNGIAQITDYLKVYPASTVHLISHGAPGVLFLGNAQLDLTNLETHTQALKSWFSGQNSASTLLLYGCNIAAGDAGEEFIETLHTLTGASIGASTTKVGNPSQGGSWNLNRQVATPTNTAVFDTAAMVAYNGVFAVTVSGLDSFTFTEGTGPIVIDNSINFASTVNYNDGSLRFDLTNGTSADQLALTSSATPNAAGAISVVGVDVYLGNGSGRDRIGSIDAVLDGTNGKDLVINFASPLTNSGFETNDLTGWTAFNQNYSSVQNLNGQTIPYTFGGGSVTGTGTIVLGTNPSASYSVVVQSSVVSTGNYALQLVSNGNISGPSGNDSPTGNGSLHGPYVRSNTFQAFTGDSITLDWAAQNGSDAYEVFGFLVGAGGDSIFGTGDDTRSRLFAQRGDTQAFNEASAVISTTGAYQFEFVGGSYDKTGGLALGASLYIDNVRLVSSTAVNDAVIAAIAQQITFENTSTAPDTTTRNLQVIAINANGESGSASSSGTVVSVNSLPTGGVTISGTAEQGSLLTATSTLGDLDGLGTLNYQWQQSSDGITWAAIAGATASTFTLTQDQVGQLVRSQVSYTDLGGTAESVFSNATASAVTNVNDSPTGSVTIDGTVAQGQILTANTSTLVDLDGLGTLSYQWQQSSDGSTWSNIDGATGVNFSPRNGQVNQFLQVAVSYVDGQGTAESLTSAPTSESVEKFNATSDFNGDGSVDIFWRHQNVGESVFWLMDNINFAGGDVLSPVISDVNWDIKALGDLNGDGNPDLVWQNKVTNQAAVWLMDGVNLETGALLPNDAASGWKVVESGDFNNNGKDDILWRNANTGELAVWFMDGTNFVSGEFITLNAGLDWEVGAVGDFTQDGKVDIFWENRITGANAFWEMDGTNFVDARTTTSAETVWQAKGSADFNQDGSLDLLWHNPSTGENALWLMDGTDLVEGVTTLPTTEVSWNPVV